MNSTHCLSSSCFSVKYKGMRHVKLFQQFRGLELLEFVSYLDYGNELCFI
jgi:hypothetical protein